MVIDNMVSTEGQIFSCESRIVQIMNHWNFA